MPETRCPSSWVPTAPTACSSPHSTALIAEHKLPPIVAISIGNGGGDAQGSERGLEYDTMSGHYAEFVETRSAAARSRATRT